MFRERFFPVRPSTENKKEQKRSYSFRISSGKLTKDVKEQKYSGKDDQNQHYKPRPEWRISEQKFVLKEKLGSGSFGHVYKATANNNLNVAIKIFRENEVQENGSGITNEGIQREANIQARYYHTIGPALGSNVRSLVTEFLPGQTLDFDDEYGNIAVHPHLKILSFAQRVNLICQLLHWFNLLHHNRWVPTEKKGNVTIREGFIQSAVAHLDIKGPNIIVHIDPKTKKTQVFLIDFNIAKELNAQDDINRSEKPFLSGNADHIAPEMVKENKACYYGTKTDIFGLTAIALRILGASDPYKGFVRASGAHDFLQSARKNHEKGFCIDGFLTSLSLPSFVMPVKNYITQFVKRMMSESYEARPDIHTTLLFFNTLNNLCKVQEKNPKDLDSQYIYIAKLAFLAEGLWDGKPSVPIETVPLTEELVTIPLDLPEQESKSKKSEPEQEKSKTSNPSFESKLETEFFCKAVVVLIQNGVEDLRIFKEKKLELPEAIVNNAVFHYYNAGIFSWMRRFFKPSEENESLIIARQLKGKYFSYNEKTQKYESSTISNEKRFRIALDYISKNPNKPFAKILSKEITTYFEGQQAQEAKTKLLQKQQLKQEIKRERISQATFLRMR